ncbi:MAG: hypothetical protein JXB49_14350, partial [Bacteroidales bacterium]|nr:hypothetical protein [Bacteroidales bacterium]
NHKMNTMKIVINPDSVTFDDLKSKLETKFSDCKFKVRAKNFLVAAKSSSIGCNILLRKNKIMVAGNFPTMGGTFLFMLSIILLGVLIPLIIYLAAFHKKMKALEKEIGAYLMETYGIPQA